MPIVHSNREAIMQRQLSIPVASLLSRMARSEKERTRRYNAIADRQVPVCVDFSRIDAGLRAGFRGSSCPVMERHAFLRKSLTRTALPCERGTSPDALMTTSQLTPRRALI